MNTPDDRPLTKERRALLQAIANDDQVDLLGEALDSERFWMQAIRNMEFGSATSCPFCRRSFGWIRDVKINPHTADCPWVLAQESQ
jgi:hypothetical protein